MLGRRQLELVQSSAQDPLVEEVASLTAELQEARKQAEVARIAAGAAASEAKVARTGAQWANDRVARLERFASTSLLYRKAGLHGCQHRWGGHLTSSGGGEEMRGDVRKLVSAVLAGKHRLAPPLCSPAAMASRFYTITCAEKISTLQ